MSDRLVAVVGSYPPIPVPGAPVSVAEVRRVWEAGEEAVVVAPRLGASHLVVPVAGVLAGRRLANVGRVTGARRLVLVVEPGLPFTQAALAHQAATAAGLIWAFRGYDHVRLVRVDGAGPAAALWRRLAAAADEVVYARGGPAAPGVTPIGPAEVPPGERARRIARRATDLVFGARAGAVRAAAARARHYLGRARRYLGRRAPL